MKKTIVPALCATFVIIFMNANALPKRVGYPGPKVDGVDYASLQSAHDASAGGDTLYIFPGSWSASFNKKLVVIGYGYFNNVAVDGTMANANMQNIVGALGISVKLNSGSDNCIFLGLDGLTLSISSSVSNLLVKRCKLSFSPSGDNHNPVNMQIVQCYINSFSINVIDDNFYFTNLSVSNSYINSFSLEDDLYAQSTGVFVNNVVNSINFNNSSFSLINNIFLKGRSGEAACTYTYNIADSLYAISNSGNNHHNKNFKTATLQTSVFEGWATQGVTSNDGRWKLKTGSPAKNAGILADGVTKTDCGMYGGSDPYKLSGIPPVPAFYKLSAPSPAAGSNPYTITFSVRANN